MSLLPAPSFLDADALAARLPNPSWVPAVYAILRSLRVDDYGIAGVRVDNQRKRLWLDLRNPHPTQGQWLPLPQCIPFKALEARDGRQAQQRQQALARVEEHRQAVATAQADRDAAHQRLEAEQARLTLAKRRLDQANRDYLQATGLGD